MPPPFLSSWLCPWRTALPTGLHLSDSPVLDCPFPFCHLFEFWSRAVGSLVPHMLFQSARDRRYAAGLGCDPKPFGLLDQIFFCFKNWQQGLGLCWASVASGHWFICIYEVLVHVAVMALSLRQLWWHYLSGLLAFSRRMQAEGFLNKTFSPFSSFLTNCVLRKKNSIQITARSLCLL